MKKLVILLSISILLESCATILIPKKQSITFNTSKDATIYLNNEEIGKGEKFKTKVEKDAKAKQVVTTSPGYKNEYNVIVPTRRQTGFWVVQPFNLGWLFIYGYYLDFLMPKNHAYPKTFSTSAINKLVYKTAEQKYINISNIKLNIKHKNKDIVDLYTNYVSASNPTKLSELEQRHVINQNKVEQKEAAKASKKNKNLLNKGSEDLKYDDTKFTEEVYKTLKKTGYVDTVNIFFSDHNNTVYLEGSIDKIYAFHVSGKSYRSSYIKCNVYLTWYVKNYFDEVIDSIKTSEYSGDFTFQFDDNEQDNNIVKSIGDAIDISYLKLHQNPAFAKYLKLETDFSIKDSLLNLGTSNGFISNKAEAGIASVIVKTKDGHGSGFAISNDGYIITNYHVVSQSANDIKIINSEGVSVSGKVVRHNKFRDIALIKVNMHFDKVFALTDDKKFNNLQDVFTIRAPKSIELGQTVSVGIISNERNYNNNRLIQLNMAVNSGNSGGPVFDSYGTIHGVIVSKAIGKSTEGICFAIPGYLIRQYLNLSVK